MMKGSRVRGDVAMSRHKDHLAHHWAECNKRMYLCNCIKQFRVGTRTKIPGSVLKRTKAGFERWLSLGAK